jgi:hypothetical protein
VNPQIVAKDFGGIFPESVPSRATIIRQIAASRSRHRRLQLIVNRCREPACACRPRALPGSEQCDICGVSITRGAEAVKLLKIRRFSLAAAPQQS